MICLCKEILDKVFGKFRVITVTYDGSELRRILPFAEKWRKDYLEVINVEDEDEFDGFIGSARDVAVGEILARHLRKKLSLPLLDCEAHEEVVYGLPEFSIYYNQDARSFCGRWTYDNAPLTLDECGLFFALIPPTHPKYEPIKKTVENLLEKEEHVAMAILERDLIE